MCCSFIASSNVNVTQQYVTTRRRIVTDLVIVNTRLITLLSFAKAWFRNQRPETQTLVPVTEFLCSWCPGRILAKLIACSGLHFFTFLQLLTLGSEPLVCLSFPPYRFQCGCCPPQRPMRIPIMSSDAKHTSVSTKIILRNSFHFPPPHWD